MKYTLGRGITCFLLCFFVGLTWAFIVLSVWSLPAFLLLGGTLPWVLVCLLGGSLGAWLVTKMALRPRPQINSHNDSIEKFALFSFKKEVAQNCIDAILGALSFVLAYLLLWWGAWTLILP